MTDDSAVFPLVVSCLSLVILAATLATLAWIGRRLARR